MTITHLGHDQRFRIVLKSCLSMQLNTYKEGDDEKMLKFGFCRAVSGVWWRG